MTGTFFGNFDLAQLALYLFWAFFAGLIFYLQRENMREGYPLVDDDGRPAPNQGPFPLPDAKTFKMPGDRPDVTVPNFNEVEREVAITRSSASTGFPMDPTGDPMADGVGPAAWAMRADEPEVDAHGHPKIQPMGKLEGFFVPTGQRDPRGIPVLSADKQQVGTLKEMWIDVPEQMIRYYEIDLGEAGTRLVPKDLSRITRAGLRIKSLNAAQFANVPTLRTADVVTKLEEEKISAYYCGGTLYAGSRSDPVIG